MNTPFDKFNAATTRWVPENALALAYASQLAYEDPQPVTAKLAQWGFDATKFCFLDKNDTQGFVAGTGQMVLVSFRGTQANDIWDWMTDADVVLRPFIAGMVHNGFYEALDDVWSDMNAAITEFRDKGQSLWLTGHSLGAALACLAVARLIFEQHAPINGLYTFGQPRTGDFTFSRDFDHEFEDKTFRFVNNDDIVTRIPPRVMGYSHVGQTMFFDNTGKLQTDDHWWNQFLTEVTVGLEGLERPASVVQEHAIQLYIDNMDRNLTAMVAL
jgi:triacylglycerol lipase